MRYELLVAIDGVTHLCPTPLPNRNLLILLPYYLQKMEKRRMRLAAAEERAQQMAAESENFSSAARCVER